MTLLGSNLFNLASQLIPPQSVPWSQWIGTTANVAGKLVPAYADPVPIMANVQPVPRAMYEQLGLDLQKNYRVVYTAQVLRDLERNASCDLIDYGGRRYNVLSNTDWQSVNGWQGSLCIDVGASP
jgi:hypothetical protein